MNNYSSNRGYTLSLETAKKYGTIGVILMKTLVFREKIQIYACYAIVLQITHIFDGVCCQLLRVHNVNEKISKITMLK